MDEDVVLVLGDLDDALEKQQSTTAGVGGDFLPVPLANTFIDLVRDQNWVRQLVQTVPMGSKTLDFPKILTGPSVYYESAENAQAVETSMTTGSVRLTAKKLFAQLKASEELFEDAAFDMDTIIRQHFVNSLADAEEEAFVDGETTHTASAVTPGAATESNWYTKDHRLIFDGLATLSTASGAATGVNGAGASITSAMIREAIYNLGVYARSMKDVVVLLNPWSANELLDDAKLVTLDKYGSQATIFTGEIGRLYGQARVLTSPYLADGKGVFFHRGNPLIGDRRLVRLRGEDVIEYDQRRLVISERLDFVVQYANAIGEMFNLDRPGSGS
jgi:HK97 family phage major capsid protein